MIDASLDKDFLDAFLYANRESWQRISRAVIFAPGVTPTPERFRFWAAGCLRVAGMPIDLEFENALAAYAAAQVEAEVNFLRDEYGYI